MWHWPPHIYPQFCLPPDRFDRGNHKIAANAPGPDPRWPRKRSRHPAPAQPAVPGSRAGQSPCRRVRCPPEHKERQLRPLYSAAGFPVLVWCPRRAHQEIANPGEARPAPQTAQTNLTLVPLSVDLATPHYTPHGSRTKPATPSSTLRASNRVWSAERVLVRIQHYYAHRAWPRAGTSARGTGRRVPSRFAV